MIKFIKNIFNKIRNNLAVFMFIIIILSIMGRYLYNSVDISVYKKISDVTTKLMITTTDIINKQNDNNIQDNDSIADKDTQINNNIKEDLKTNEENIVHNNIVTDSIDDKAINNLKYIDIPTIEEFISTKSLFRPIDLVNENNKTELVFNNYCSEPNTKELENKKTVKPKKVAKKKQKQETVGIIYKPQVKYKILKPKAKVMVGSGKTYRTGIYEDF